MRPESNLAGASLLAVVAAGLDLRLAGSPTALAGRGMWAGGGHHTSNIRRMDEEGVARWYASPGLEALLARLGEF